MKSGRQSIMKGGAYMCMLTVFLCYNMSWVTSTSLSEGSNRSCPLEKKCSCSKGADGTYEVQCYQTVQENNEEIIYASIQPGNSATFQCFPTTEWKDFSLLTGLQVEDCPMVIFRFCPLPDYLGSPLNHKSFKSFFDSIFLQKTSTFAFQSHSTLSDTLKAKHLEGLSGVTKVILSDNGLTNLTGDLFSGMPDLKWINLRDNKIILPPLLFQGLPYLVNINMGKNDLSYLPPDIFKGLANVTLLNLDRNKLGDTNLTRLHFRDMSSLDSLDLSSNSLKMLNEDVFYNLTSLRILSLNSNSFISLPAGLFKYNVLLEHLRLNDNHVSLFTLPDGFLSNLTSLRNVSLDRCGIEELPSNLLRGSVNLFSFSMQNNKLKHLPVDLFVGLRNLESINLNGNQLSSMPDSIFNGLSFLRILWLNHNSITSLPPSLFHDLVSLEELNLQNNKLRGFSHGTFIRKDNLHRLYLSNNFFTFEDVDGQSSPLSSCTNLEELNLSNNTLKYIFLDWRASMLHLVNLNLSHNHISYITIHDLHFLSDKIVVDLRYNNISIIELNGSEVLATSQQESLRDRNVEVLLDNNPVDCNCNIYYLLHYLEDRIKPQVKRLVNLKIRDLKCAHPPSLVGQSLTDLSSYNLTCDMSLEVGTFEEDEWIYQESLKSNSSKLNPYTNSKCPQFCHCLFRPEDRALIVDCNGANLTRLPYSLPVTNITLYTELLASDLGITKLWSHSSLPLGYDQVKVLKLGKNSLRMIDAPSLPPHVNILELHDNNLTYLNKDVIAAISNASEISLHGNPWKCDCETKDLLEFIQERFKQVKFLPNVTCKSGYHDSKPLSQLTANDLCPLPVAKIVASCISVAAIGIILGVIAALYYRHQHAIKIWLFAHNLCLWFVTEEELDKDKEYDAFISYSHQDEDFVVSELVPVLEGGKVPDKCNLSNQKAFSFGEGRKDVCRYKLCLHYRDWIAGEWIPAQIARSVDTSRRTIVILSPAFLESVWGQMEFRAAHCQALAEGRTRVIVILYGDIPPTESLDPELRTYLTTNTYVKWGDPWFWQKLKYALPHNRNKTVKKVPLTVNVELNHKHLENGNGQCRQYDLNPPVEVLSMNV